MPLLSRENRPWPVSDRPWVMKQVWHDLLFAHWPVEAAALRSLIPPALELETFDGAAWLGIIPFRMTGVTPRWVPPLPWFSAFLELNVRTYVSDGTKPGVWFFSLDAANSFPVAAGRRLFSLPYYRADMELRREGSMLEYRSVRTDPRGPNAELAAQYEPTAPAEAPSESLTRWLTYRYCLYAARKDGRLFRTEIDHGPWPLQIAQAQFRINTMANPLGVRLVGKPLCHFSKMLAVNIWAPTSI